MKRIPKILKILGSTMVFLAIWINLAGADLPYRDDFLEPWTSIGSAGTVEEGDLLLVSLGQPLPGDIKMRNTGRPGIVHVRYNIVAIDGLLMNHDGYWMRARFRDKGPNEQIILKLVAYGIESGIAETLLTLDSDDYAGDDGYQVQYVSTLESQGCLNKDYLYHFSKKAYYVDATIKKTRAAGDPVLSIIQVGGFTCWQDPFLQD